MSTGSIKVRVWGGGAYVETPYRMKITLYQYQHYNTLYNHYMLLLYQIRSVMWMLSQPLRVCLSTNIFTTSFLINIGIMCLVSWWLVWSRVETCAQIGNSVLLPEDRDRDCFHQLPQMTS